MDAHAPAHDHDEGHAHPTPGTYLKIALVLFALTALEVLAYELARRPTAPIHTLIAPVVVPVLLVLSAAKFALVAMFYMHLKQDSKVFSSLFVLPILIAATLIVMLVILINYWYHASY
jgi:cytochrome c oxidase subunit IV